MIGVAACGSAADEVVEHHDVRKITDEPCVHEAMDKERGIIGAPEVDVSVPFRVGESGPNPATTTIVEPDVPKKTGGVLWTEPVDRERLCVSHAVPPSQVSSRSGVVGVNALTTPIIVSRLPSIGLLYYSDCRGDEQILTMVRRQIERARPRNSQIVAVTLQPIKDCDNWQQIVLPLERGYLTMFRQILAGLEVLDADIVFHVEHDLAYHPSHFDFVPPQRDRYWYNQHTWKVDAATGRALHYRCCQTSGLCGDRRLLLEHYRRRLAAVEANGGYQRHMGFEPGTNRWARSLDGVGYDTWMSAKPNVDIRHGRNLTKSRWSRDEFRNKNSCLGWTESQGVPGWGVTAGRFDAWLTTMLKEPTLVPLMGRS